MKVVLNYLLGKLTVLILPSFSVIEKHTNKYSRIFFKNTLKYNLKIYIYLELKKQILPEVYNYLHVLFLLLQVGNA